MTEERAAGWTLFALRQAVLDFRLNLESAGREPLTVHSYVDQASRFVRWLAGDYRPRSLSSAAPPRSQDHSWTPSDLKEDHRQYREMLIRARLKPLAIQTYVHSSGIFLSWLIPSRFEPTAIPIPSPITLPPPPKEQPTSGSDDWLWEGNVQRVLRDWLTSEGWTVVSEADAAIRQRGVDLLVRRDTRKLAIEVKGYPQALMLRGVNKGKPRATIPHPKLVNTSPVRFSPRFVCAIPCRTPKSRLLFPTLLATATWSRSL